MKKNICIFTGSRSEYGILKNLINKLEISKDFNLHLIVSGSHLSKKYGYSLNEIKKDKIKNIHIVDINISNETPSNILNSISIGLSSFKKKLLKIKPDIVLYLGDRYELIPIALSSFFLKIPTFHIHGGEKTLGSDDDIHRHIVTKLSNVHLVANKNYKKRVIQLGEEPQSVFDVGSLSIENINSSSLYKINEIIDRTKIRDLKKNKYFLIVFHPYKDNKKSLIKNLDILLNTLLFYKNKILIFTYPNHDLNSDIVIKKLLNFKKNNKCSFIFKNLGRKLYLSLLHHSELLIGNSSSGIIEAPSFKKPVINIGNRQDGRIRASSILSCDFSKKKIIKNISTATSKSFMNKLKYVKNPYYKKHTSDKILNILKEYKKGKVDKNFYDL